MKLGLRRDVGWIGQESCLILTQGVGGAARLSVNMAKPEVGLAVQIGRGPRAARKIACGRRGIVASQRQVSKRVEA